jgi:hypothetical protein
MAAVTVASGWPRTNVNGSYRELYYKFDIAADADHLDVPLRNIKDAQLTDDTIQAVGIASITNGVLNVYTSRIVFNSVGAITNCRLKVTGN